MIGWEDPWKFQKFLNPLSPWRLDPCRIDRGPGKSQEFQLKLPRTAILEARIARRAKGMTTTLDDPLRTARREELAGKVRAWLRADESSTVVDVKNADPLEDGFVADMMRFMGNDNVDTRSLVSGKSAVLDEIVSMVDGDTDVVSLGVDDLVEVEASGQVEVCGEDVAPDFGDRDNLAKKFSAAYAARERRRTMRRQRDARTIISQTTSGGFTDDPVVTDLLARLQAATPVSRTAIAATLAALSEEQLQLLASAMEGASSLQLDDATVCMLCETLFPDGDQVVSRAYHSYVALVRAVLLRRVYAMMECAIAITTCSPLPFV